MTIGVAWIRGTSDADELWMASDSRLSGDGNLWDDCPKLFLLPRRDAVAAFSGRTGQAYPLVSQIANAMQAYRAASSGTLEFFDLVGHLERVINSMLGRLRADPAVTGAQPLGREFSSRGDVILLGGFSRRKNAFVLRALQYQALTSSWVFTRVRGTRSLGQRRTVRIFGDRVSSSRYRYALKSLLKERNQLGGLGKFDLEPLEALIEFLQRPESAVRPLPLGRRPPTVGGAPQVIRVLAGAQATPFVVRWEERSGNWGFPYSEGAVSGTSG